MVISPVVINDHVVEVVHTCKYLVGTVIDEKWTFEAHVDAVCKKVHQRMLYLRKLCSFKVDSTVMKMFYSCCIESVMTFSSVCRMGHLMLKTETDCKVLLKCVVRLLASL